MINRENDNGKWTRAYELERPKFEAYCTDIQRIVRGILKENGIHVHSVECRSKDVDSFRKKVAKTENDGSPKYNEPLKEITDLAAVRVIVFTNSYVQKVCDIIEQAFSIKWKKDVGEERSQSKDFGYQSVHYLVVHTEERLKLQDYKKYAGMICEVQVRTILQHAWAEIEHDIQYKSENEIPKEIGRKFRALAGLIEIADREFQSIQDTDVSLKNAIQKSAANELTRDAIIQLDAQASMSNVGANDASKTAEVTIDQLSSAREFILSGKYKEALQIFDQNIALNPNAHTQYIGRAKVRFLLGDRSGALFDLDEAGKYAPDDHALKSIRLQIEEGALARALTERSSFEEYKMGTKALADGRGEAAFVSFSNAQDGGYNYAFATFNKAMACVLVGDTKGGTGFINELSRIPDTPMEINLVALSCIIQLMEEVDPTESILDLEHLLEKKPDFSLDISPLSGLKRGMAARYGDAETRTDKIFELLSRK